MREPHIFGTGRNEVLDPTKCKARVCDHDSRWPQYYQCRHKPARDGWCNAHHPEKVAARRAKSDDKYNAQNAYGDYLDKRKLLRNNIAEAVISGCSPEEQAKLVKSYKEFEANKPPAVSLPAWRRY